MIYHLCQNYKLIALYKCNETHFCSMFFKQPLVVYNIDVFMHYHIKYDINTDK